MALAIDCIAIDMSTHSTMWLAMPAIFAVYGARLRATHTASVAGRFSILLFTLRGTVALLELAFLFVCPLTCVRRLRHCVSPLFLPEHFFFFCVRMCHVCVVWVFAQRCLLQEAYPATQNSFDAPVCAMHFLSVFECCWHHRHRFCAFLKHAPHMHFTFSQYCGESSKAHRASLSECPN